jgi:hypothetical protein
MSIARNLNRSQKDLERALGRPTFTWNDGTYACTATSASKSKDLTPGGFTPEADLNLFVRAELFPSDGQPQPKDKLTYRGNLYRISEVVTLPGDGLLKLVCMDSNRKA